MTTLCFLRGCTWSDEIKADRNGLTLAVQRCHRCGACRYRSLESMSPLRSVR
ncbi:PSPA7_2676 family Cys-rich small protein [Pseudomonas sp.]|uniref:PSPA7_2676 family Cys-rich small protein n=1 Tax=Pseudomonas sp. TaxID=306 RepID=UPI003459665B